MPISNRPTTRFPVAALACDHCRAGAAEQIQHTVTSLAAVQQRPFNQLMLEASITSRKRDPEGLNRIRETVAALLRLPSKHLKKLVVEGREEDGTADFPVDLIKSRIKYEVDLGQEGIADADRHRAVRKAWMRNRDELRNRFTPRSTQPS